MMSKLFLVVFSCLTIGAGYMTYKTTRDYESVTGSSIRSGSSGYRSGSYGSGGYSFGK